MYPSIFGPYVKMAVYPEVVDCSLIRPDHLTVKKLTIGPHTIDPLLTPTDILLQQGAFGNVQGDKAQISVFVDEPLK
jgi:hypothetical protein